MKPVGGRGDKRQDGRGEPRTTAGQPPIKLTALCV
jgi:hypothetical protein